MNIYNFYDNFLRCFFKEESLNISENPQIYKMSQARTSSEMIRHSQLFFQIIFISCGNSLLGIVCKNKFIVFNKYDGYVKRANYMWQKNRV